MSIDFGKKIGRIRQVSGMQHILLLTLRVISLVGLAGLAGEACVRDEFAPAYRETRMEVIREAAQRFGPGRLAGVPWSPPLAPPTSEPSTTSGSGSKNEDAASTRGDVARVLSPIEYAKKGLENLVDPGEGFTLDRVVEYYELAFVAGQHDPSFLNDFAVALLERGSLRDVILAGEFAARARDAAAQVDPNGELAQAARFNWAMALERLALHGQATEAWQEVLDRETNAAWRFEAEGHTDDLDLWPVVRWSAERTRLRQAAARGDSDSVASIVAEFRTPSRLLAEEDELRVWAETVESDPLRASKALAIARTIGKALAPTDTLLADVVASIDAASVDAIQTAEMSAAVQRFFSGFEKYRERAYESARNELSIAASALEGMDNPLARKAEFLHLTASNHLGLGAVLEQSDLLLAQLDSTSYAALRSQIIYLRGWLRSRAGYYEGSLRNLDQAVTETTRLGELDLAAAYGSAYGSSLDLAHDVQGAEAVDTVWLALSSSVVKPYYRYFTAYAIKYRAALEGAYAVASATLNEAALILPDLDSPFFAAETHTNLYAQALDQGDAAKAQRQRELALREAVKLNDPSSREYQRARIDWAAARQKVLPIQARLRLYSQALNGFSGIPRNAPKLSHELNTERRFALHQSSILNEMAGLELKAGDSAASQAHYRQAFDLLTKRLYEDQPQSGGYGLAAEARPIVRALLNANRESPEASEELFRWTEWGNHLAAPGRSHPRVVDDLAVAQALPTGTALVELGVLDQSLIVFLFRHGNDTFEKFDLPIKSLGQDRACLGARRGAKARCPDWESQARRFSREAIEPWLCSLPRDTRLVIVPGALADVPFSALPIHCPGERLERLIDRQIPSLAASATTWIEAHAKASALAATGLPKSLLAVGIAHSQEAPAPLEYAPREARAVTELYGEFGLSLIEESASRERILALAASQDVIHFATHSEIDPRRLGASFLSLVGETLTIEDIGRATRRLANSRLVVLSACQTTGTIEGVEGLIGVSRAFLDAGVPTVAATLGQIKDRASAELMIEFHRRYLKTGDAARSLAETQREANKEMNGRSEGKIHPEWAMWVVLGG